MCIADAYDGSMFCLDGYQEIRYSNFSLHFYEGENKDCGDDQKKSDYRGDYMAAASAVFLSDFIRDFFSAAL